MRFSLDSLKAFKAAAETGSFSAASRQLGKAQSGVSAAIANLEVDLGVSLFDRSGKFPVLTLEGEHLLSHAKMLLSQCEKFENRADRLASGEQLLLKVAIDELLPVAFMADVFLAFADRYPQIELEILWGAMGDVTGLVLSDRADVGIEMPLDLKPQAGCIWQVLARTSFCGVVSAEHPLAGEKELTPELLRPHRQILATSRAGNRLPEEYRFGEELWQCEDSNLILELVRKGVAWATFPRYQVAQELQRGTLFELPITLGECGLPNTFFYIWQHKRPLTEAEKWLGDTVATMLQTLCAE